MYSKMEPERAPNGLVARGRRRTPARRCGGDEGAVLIEFALMAPLIFALLVGMITGGVSLSRKNSMTNAVREGARLGATITADGLWADAVRARVVELSSGDLTTSQVCVKLVKKGPPGPTTVLQSSSCAGALAGEEPSVADVPAGDCAVLVWAQRPTEIEAVFFSMDITLDSDSVSRYERDCTTP